MHGDFALLVSLSVSFALALVLGLVTERLRLSPIVGYLVAGVILGPYTPGFVGDQQMAQQMAEIGVVLLMFGVGMHFDVRDLLAVRGVAIPGAVGQITVATLLGMLAMLAFGHDLGPGLVIGVAISVASTVVLMRVLTDNNVLDSSQGHIAVGWLIVEDIFTVLVLVVLPGLMEIWNPQAAGGGAGLVVTLLMAIAKVFGLGLCVILLGRKPIPWLLNKVAKTRSSELFTLAVLSLALAIATGSAVVFGVSMALGAFLAGMAVGQTEVSHQAAASALPMRDAFAVLFFVSVGMLFDPASLLREPGLLICLLGVILLAKPLTAAVIVWALRGSVRTALTVAVGLAQVGEFSFVLADEALGLGVLSPGGQSLLVASALISITLNPLLFRAIGPMEQWFRKHRRLWQLISRRSEQGASALNADTQSRLGEAVEPGQEKVRAVVIGYGPVGQTAARILQQNHIEPVIVDLNLDSIRAIVSAGGLAIYGDATRHDILEAAGVRQAKYLLMTIPDIMTRTVMILAAKEMNPNLRVFVRARYLQERAWLEEVGATGICTEEGETAIGLAVLILREVGADQEQIREEIRRIQAEMEGRPLVE